MKRLFFVGMLIGSLSFGATHWKLVKSENVKGDTPEKIKSILGYPFYFKALQSVFQDTLGSLLVGEHVEPITEIELIAQTYDWEGGETKWEPHDSRLRAIVGRVDTVRRGHAVEFFSYSGPLPPPREEDPCK